MALLPGSPVELLFRKGPSKLLKDSSKLLDIVYNNRQTLSFRTPSAFLSLLWTADVWAERHTHAKLTWVTQHRQYGHKIYRHYSMQWLYSTTDPPQKYLLVRAKTTNLKSWVSTDLWASLWLFNLRVCQTYKHRCLFFSNFDFKKQHFDSTKEGAPKQTNKKQTHKNVGSFTFYYVITVATKCYGLYFFVRILGFYSCSPSTFCLAPFLPWKKMLKSQPQGSARSDTRWELTHQFQLCAQWLSGVDLPFASDSQDIRKWCDSFVWMREKTQLVWT